jgi:hypothetical protein
MEKDNVLVVPFIGGFGNQIFEYVFYMWLKSNYPDKKVYADLSYYIKFKPHNGFELTKVFPKIKIDILSARESFRVNKELPMVYGGPGKHKANALRKAINRSFFGNRPNIYFNEENNFGVMAVRTAIEEGKRVLSGYWQDVEYYLDVLDVLSDTLVFAERPKLLFEDEIRLENAVSVHVRRGDYVGTSRMQETGDNYYKKAVEYISEKVENPVFYFFSDDPDYVQKNFDWLDNIVIVRGNNTSDSGNDMYLMSLCKHNIIANSSYSTWAAYLNGNPEKIVVYPDVPFMQRMKLDDWHGISICK